MVNKRSIRVFVNSSEMFMRCALNQSFLCCPEISVDILVIPLSHQKLSFLKSGVSNSSTVSLPINRE